jgi:hypothetical protein
MYNVYIITLSVVALVLVMLTYLVFKLFSYCKSQDKRNKQAYATLVAMLGVQNDLMSKLIDLRLKVTQTVLEQATSTIIEAPTVNESITVEHVLDTLNNIEEATITDSVGNTIVKTEPVMVVETNTPINNNHTARVFNIEPKQYKLTAGGSVNLFTRVDFDNKLVLSSTDLINSYFTKTIKQDIHFVSEDVLNYIHEAVIGQNDLSDTKLCLVSHSVDVYGNNDLNTKQIITYLDIVKSTENINPPLSSSEPENLLTSSINNTIKEELNQEHKDDEAELQTDSHPALQITFPCNLKESLMYIDYMLADYVYKEPLIGKWFGLFPKENTIPLSISKQLLDSVIKSKQVDSRLVSTALVNNSYIIDLKSKEELIQIKPMDLDSVVTFMKKR